MKFEGKIVENKLNKRLKEIEKEKDIKFSNTQKVLLTVEGSITAILDVLYGKVSIFTLSRHFEKANQDTSELVNIDEGEEINYREVIIHRREQPLIYALSLIVLDRCKEEARQDIIDGEIPLGKVLKKHKVESRREIQHIYIEKPDATLRELFKTSEDFITRNYIVIENDEITIWTKESFPISYFSDKM
ncbi:chorismate--pyruvate lyase family protein [Methanobrevibacter sp. UBA212]|uniref:chorismate--pyruvate lyase family protein n=1 Tax=Methanobrevibacter sp. UBA212 TaxID=1915476 RepID=UPI0025F07532|nr:chorismate lyase [Methanobrevibacter sp. UBA212]